MKVDIDYLKNVLFATEEATGYPSAIGGGYLRDLDYGIESKDLDVFIIALPMSSELDLISNMQEVVDSKIETLDLSLRMSGLVDYSVLTKDPRWFQNSPSGSNMRDDVVGVKKYYCSDLDFVLMRADSWKDVTKNFDVSICQILCRLEQGKLNIYASNSYMRHKKGSPILRFYPVPTCNSHVARIKAKFGKVQGTYSTDGSLNHVGELTEEGIVYYE